MNNLSLPSGSSGETDVYTVYSCSAVVWAGMAQWCGQLWSLRRLHREGEFSAEF